MRKRNKDFILNSFILNTKTSECFLILGIPITCYIELDGIIIPAYILGCKNGKTRIVPRNIIDSTFYIESDINSLPKD